MFTLGMFLIVTVLFFGGVWWACSNEDHAQ